MCRPSQAMCKSTRLRDGGRGLTTGGIEDLPEAGEVLASIAVYARKPPQRAEMSVFCPQNGLKDEHEQALQMQMVCVAVAISLGFRTRI